MSSDRETTRIVRSWLEDGVTQLPDRVLDSVLDQLPATPQRRAWWPARRFPVMNKIVGFGLAAAAVVAAILIGSRLLSPPANVGGPDGTSTANPEPTATPAPTSAPGAGLPEGAFDLTWEGASDLAPRIMVTIPAPGWIYQAEPGALSKGDEANNLPEAAILPFSEPAGSAFYVYGDPCRLESTRPETPATTVDEIASALVAQASREASEPVDVTVGGYAGKTITLHVPEDASPSDCEGGEFASFGIEEDALARYHQGPGQVDELWIIDVDGAIVILDTMYRADTPTGLIDELRAISQSATFELP